MTSETHRLLGTGQLTSSSQTVSTNKQQQNIYGVFTNSKFISQSGDSLNMDVFSLCLLFFPKGLKTGSPSQVITYAWSRPVGVTL